MYNCEWCGDECDDSFKAIRHRKLSFINHGIVSEGEATQEILVFCTPEHRYDYLFGI